VFARDRIKKHARHERIFLFDLLQTRKIIPWANKHQGNCIVHLLGKWWATKTESWFGT